MKTKKRQNRLVRSYKAMQVVAKEMFGKPSVIEKFNIFMDMYSANSSVDYSKVDYTLTQAIYFASVRTNPITGECRGEQFLLGAGLGKPIVNSTVAFALSTPIKINIADNDELETAVNDWLEEQHPVITKLVRDAMRDGDSYVSIENEGELRKYAPIYVDKVVNPMNIEDVYGYDIKAYIPNGSSAYNKNDYYLTEIRKDKKTVTKIKDGNRTNVSTDKLAGLNVFHFANEREAGELYGNSDYQGLYLYMSQYHDLLESGVGGTIVNAQPIKYITGIENKEDFAKMNGDTNADGSISLDLSSKKVLVGGAGTSFGVVQGSDATSGVVSLLGMLFYLILEHSETPEFIIGSAVSSSKASTDSQMPIMVAKAQRKQGEFARVIKEMIDYFITNVLKAGEGIEYKIVMPEIVNDNTAELIQTATMLLNAGAITKATAIRMTGADKYVEDIERELADADEEKQASVQQLNEQFTPTTNDRAKNETKKNGKVSEQESS